MNQTFTESFEFAGGTETTLKLTASFEDASFDHAFGTEHIPLALEDITFEETEYTPAQCLEIQAAIDKGKFESDAYDYLVDAREDAAEARAEAQMDAKLFDNDKQPTTYKT